MAANQKKSMSQKWQLVTLSGLVSLFVVCAPFSVLADNYDFTNDMTGPNSENTNTATTDRTFNFSSTNTGTATTTFNLDANSGNNTVSGNTVVGNVSTGDINAELEVSNEINTQAVTVPASNTSSVSASATNDTTGPNSSNTNTITTNTTRNVAVTNTGTATTNATIVANTGGNTIANNTRVGDIRTGNINVDVTVDNRINTPASPAPSTSPRPNPTTTTQPTGPNPGPTTLPVVPAPTQTTPTVIRPIIPAVGGGQPRFLAAIAAPTTTKTFAQAPAKQFFPAGAANQLPLWLAGAFITLALILDSRMRNLLAGAVPLLLSGRYFRA